MLRQKVGSPKFWYREFDAKPSFFTLFHIAGKKAVAFDRSRENKNPQLPEELIVFRGRRKQDVSFHVQLLTLLKDKNLDFIITISRC